MSRPPDSTPQEVRPIGYVFFDTHQDTYTYAVAPEGREEPTAARTIGVEPRQVRKALRRLEQEYELRMCY